MDDRLVAAWRDGQTAMEICLSGEFRGFTRNAIIGRIHRVRKKRGADVVTHRGRQPVPTAPKKRRRRRRGKTNNFNIADRGTLLADPTPLNAPPAPPKARRIPLLELGPRDCRFIVTGHDTREHLYCAADASAFADDYGNNCYCGFHQRVMRAHH